jgi:hypothetical protein
VRIPCTLRPLDDITTLSAQKVYFYPLGTEMKARWKYVTMFEI